VRRVYALAALMTGVAALSVSWWSLYSVALLVHTPAVLAAGLSSVFDLAALVAVGLAERYAESEIAGSGAGPRLALLGMLGGSIYLNAQHAELTHVGMVGAVAYAAPAAVAVVLVELHLRYANRAQRHNLGRVAPAMPVLGAAAWIFHPLYSLRVLSRTARCRLVELDPLLQLPDPSGPVRALGEVIRPIDPAADRTSDVRAELAELPHDAARVRHLADLLDGQATPAHIRQRLAELGHHVTGNAVRQALRRRKPPPAPAPPPAHSSTGASVPSARSGNGDPGAGLLETMHLLRSPANARRLSAVMERAERGQFHEHALIDPGE
jgi:hypothetical protein